MKINISQTSPEGFIVREKIDPATLDLDSDIIKFQGPLNVSVEVSRITNAVTVNVGLESKIKTFCSRCLQEYELGLTKEVKLNYLVGKNDKFIDLDPDIREDIILELPVKPLCKADCKGLCSKCGNNLNQGGCSCGST
jgi:uncharacterized protein